MHQPRIYREKMNRARFVDFSVVMDESDLWIGIDAASYQDEMADAVGRKLHEIREILNSYIQQHPDFESSFQPLPVFDDDHEIIKRMKNDAISAHTGPLASVAGLVAEEIGKFLIEEYHVEECVIENGGDLYCRIKNDILLGIDAGNNHFFQKLALILPADIGSAGICTSSGMFGHSISLGKADSVTVVTHSASLSDAWATSIANRVQHKNDVEKALDLYQETMISLVVIKDDQIGIKGDLFLDQMV